MSVKTILETEYPDEDWSHLDGGQDGEQPVFYISKGSYYTYTFMWPSGLTQLTSAQIETLLTS